MATQPKPNVKPANVLAFKTADGRILTDAAEITAYVNAMQEQLQAATQLAKEATQAAAKAEAEAAAAKAAKGSDDRSKVRIYVGGENAQGGTYIAFAMPGAKYPSAQLRPDVWAEMLKMRGEIEAAFEEHKIRNLSTVLEESRKAKAKAK